jgi:hypothetical protein
MMTCATVVLLAGLGLLMLQGWLRMEARRQRARDEQGHGAKE